VSNDESTDITADETFPEERSNPERAAAEATFIKLCGEVGCADEAAEMAKTLHMLGYVITPKELIAALTKIIRSPLGVVPVDDAPEGSA
jgi:hypothetical protein